MRRQDGNGLLGAVEILLNNSAVSNLIREGKTDQLESTMQGGGVSGMQTMDSVLAKLLRQSLISQEEAYLKAFNKSAFAKPEQVDHS